MKHLLGIPETWEKYDAYAQRPLNVLFTPFPFHKRVVLLRNEIWLCQKILFITILTAIHWAKPKQSTETIFLTSTY